MVEPLFFIILTAFILDLVFGDPESLPHPIIWMGNAIAKLEPWFRDFFSNLVTAGIVFAGLLIVSTWLIAFLVVKAAGALHPALGILVQTVLAFYCFSSKSLKEAAMAVYKALKNQDVMGARIKVGYIVGRQTDQLEVPAITRATIETVAENFVDGFLSPLFFAVIGGAPLAMAYKMTNTLDSMVGYKNDRYIEFGKGSARIDDAANFIPARLSVLCISLAGMLFSRPAGIDAFKTALKEGRHHKSPNAGFPEAAFAGALKIRLGGPSVYHGKRVEKPFLGSRYADPEPDQIKQACDLMILACLVATLMACLVLWWI